MTPRPLLHLECAAVFALSLAAYHWTHGSWLLFAVLFLTPDVSMAGYALSIRVGTFAYNAVHTYVGPLLLAAFAFESGRKMGWMIALIWLAHIGMDRMLGFGLKYPTHFKDTHLNPDRHALDMGSPSFGRLWHSDKRSESNLRNYPK